MKFYKWYTQSLGYIAALICCLYCCLRGDLLLYCNLSGNYDYLAFNQILASYILYPLCVLTFFLTLLVGLIPQYGEKLILGFNVIKISIFFKYLLIIIGILGCGIYFLIPTLIILLSNFIQLILIIINKIPIKEKHHKEYTLFNKIIKINSIKNTLEAKTEHSNHPQNLTDEKLMLTKHEIAIQLLEKDSDINFICDLTGFSKDYIKKLKKEDILNNYKK